MTCVPPSRSNLSSSRRNTSLWLVLQLNPCSLAKWFMFILVSLPSSWPDLFPITPNITPSRPYLLSGWLSFFPSVFPLSRPNLSSSHVFPAILFIHTSLSHLIFSLFRKLFKILFYSSSKPTKTLMEPLDPLDFDPQMTSRQFFLTFTPFCPIVGQAGRRFALLFR